MSESVHFPDGRDEGTPSAAPLPEQESAATVRHDSAIVDGPVLPVHPEAEEQLPYLADTPADAQAAGEEAAAGNDLLVESVAKEPLDDRGRTPAERAYLREEILARSRMTPAERRRRAANSPHIKALLERMAWRKSGPPGRSQ